MCVLSQLIRASGDSHTECIYWMLFDCVFYLPASDTPTGVKVMIMFSFNQPQTHVQVLM